jgi:hypothetical protein
LAGVVLVTIMQKDSSRERPGGVFFWGGVPLPGEGKRVSVDGEMKTLTGLGNEPMVDFPSFWLTRRAIA